jgi:hypothetical protein
VLDARAGAPAARRRAADRPGRQAVAGAAGRGAGAGAARLAGAGRALSAAGAKLAVSLDLAASCWTTGSTACAATARETVWLMQISSKVLDKQGKKGAPRGDKLIGPGCASWPPAAAGTPVTGYLVARDAWSRWRRSTATRPCPAGRTGGAVARQPRPAAAGGLQDGAGLPARRRRARSLRRRLRDQRRGRGTCLARLWPDFAALARGRRWPRRGRGALRPLAAWLRDSVSAAPFAGEAHERTAAAPDFPAARLAPDRGQRRHRQDLDHRRAVPAPGAGPRRPRRLRAPAAAARDPGDDLHPRRHARAVEPRARAPGAGGAPLPRRAGADDDPFLEALADSYGHEAARRSPRTAW